MVANLGVAVTPRFFPYGDTPNHLARYTLIAASWSGTAPAWVHFRWLPTGYIAIDVIGAALVALTSPIAALRILVAAYVILLPLGAYALLRAVNPRTVGWSIVACLLTFNWYFLAGFLSYAIGIALALLWLAWWWPRRDTTKLSTRAVGAAGIAGLYLVHMAAAATALVAVGIACLEPALWPRTSRDERPDHRRMLARVTSAAVYSIPAVALNLLMKASSTLPPAQDGIVFRSTRDKLLHLAAPFVSFSRVDGIAVASAYLIAFVLCWSARRFHAVSVWPLVAGALLLCYFVCPVFLFAAWDVDVRFLLPAAIIAFVGTTPDRRGDPSAVGILLLASVTLLHAWNTSRNATQIDVSVGNVLATLRQIPQPASTLVLVSDEGNFFRVDPFLHAGEWLTIEHPSARVNGLFSGGANGAYLAHFIVRPELYDPGVHWAGISTISLDWRKIRQDYNYIALVGTNRNAQARIESEAAPYFGGRATTVYTVKRDSRVK